MRHLKRLTTCQERAALPVAEDALTDEQIAAQTDVHRATLDRWRRRNAQLEAQWHVVERVFSAAPPEGVSSETWQGLRNALGLG